MRWKRIIIIFLILLSGVVYYWLVNQIKYPTQTITVSQVVDGDTIKDQMGNSYRLLGINTPEKEQLYYSEAKDYMKELIEGREGMLCKLC